MTELPPFPRLPAWTQQGVRSLYTAKSPQEFDTAFDAFVAPDARIHLNGKQLSREQYKQRLRGETSGETGANVTFGHIVSVPESGSDMVGAVGVSFAAELFHKFVVFGERQANTVHSSLNIEVVAKRPSTVDDARRVMVLNEVQTDRADKIIPPTTDGA